jgi:hypothetical protein
MCCRSGKPITVARELSRCRLDLVGLQEVRWDKGGTEPVEVYNFSYRKADENHYWRLQIFVRKKLRAV